MKDAERNQQDPIKREVDRLKQAVEEARNQQPTGNPQEIPQPDKEPSRNPFQKNRPVDWSAVRRDLLTQDGVQLRDRLAVQSQLETSQQLESIYQRLTRTHETMAQLFPELMMLSRHNRLQRRILWGCLLSSTFVALLLLLNLLLPLLR